MTLSTAHTIAILRIEIKYIEPLIWRRVGAVCGPVTLPPLRARVPWPRTLPHLAVPSAKSRCSSGTGR